MFCGPPPPPPALRVVVVLPPFRFLTVEPEPAFGLTALPGDFPAPTDVADDD